MNIQDLPRDYSERFLLTVEDNETGRLFTGIAHIWNGIVSWVSYPIWDLEASPFSTIRGWAPIPVLA